ncbi:MAG: hypothetical protein V7K68_18565 [Nostoc sp.]|uniref:hypothetical protein n=1 Tax=Nostoc sp. TaxID=1180 RepID=UPI002FF7EA08
MGLSTDYLGIPDWVNKPEGYQAGVTVRYNQNIFKTAFWGSEPGVGNPEENGWRFDDELYDLTSQTHTQEAKIIAYIPTWRKTEGFGYANEKIYQNITHGIISFLMFEEKNLGEFTQTSVNDVNEILDDVVTRGHKNNAKILIALKGATDYGFLYLMEKIGNNPSDPLLSQTVCGYLFKH